MFAAIMAAASPTQAEIALPGMTIRPRACEILVAGNRFVLEPQVMRMLAVLAASVGEVVPKDLLIERCWDGRSVSEDAVNRVVSRIRKLAEETGVFELQTQRKVGYRLVSSILDDGQASAREMLTTPPAPPFAGAPSRTRRSWLFALAGALTLASVILVWALWRGRPVHFNNERAITVLLVPAHPQDAAHAREITSDLRQSLSRVRGLRIVNSQSRDADLLVEGKIDQSSSRGSVLLTLKRAQSGDAIWSGRFAQSSTLIPEQQRAVAAIVRYLAVWLSDTDGGARAAREPERGDVSQLVTQGARAWQRGGEERQRQNMQAANRLYAQASAKADAALSIDPESAKALMLRYQIDELPDFPRPEETQVQFEDRKRRADRTLTHALTADPDDPAVLVAAAQEFYRSSDWTDAGALLRRAISFDHRSADTNSWYAYHLALLGRCEEGMRYAQASVQLEPESLWRKRAIPRLFQCAGKAGKSLSAYHVLMQRDPANSSLIREAYLVALSTRDANVLRSLAASLSAAGTNKERPDATSALLARIRAAVAAFEGNKRMLEELVDRDVRATAENRNRSAAASEADTLFALAYEYAHIGAVDKALASLTHAHDMGSTYLPWALPFGSSEFPAPLKSDPRYKALWSNSPGWADLMQQRSLGARHAHGGPVL